VQLLDRECDEKKNSTVHNRDRPMPAAAARRMMVSLCAGV